MLGRFGGISTILLLGMSNTLPEVLANCGGSEGKKELKKFRKPERKPPLLLLTETDSNINSGSTNLASRSLT